MTPRRRPPRLAVGAMVAAITLVLATPPAGADPPVPTDYLTTIESVDPAVPGLELRMIGGDSFLQLTAPEGSEVLVVGYQGEPYLRFEPDGTVLRNERSPSTYVNDDRFGSVQIPPEASADAEPLWQQVASGGSYAWHDHRTHWMNRDPPPGRERGDVILEAVVPLTVDGREVRVAVQSVWLPDPSPVAAVAGGALGVVVAALAAVGASRVRRWDRAVVAALAGLGAAALAVGAGQVLSLPSETEPSPLLWALPAGALALGAASQALVAPALRAGMVLLALVPLAGWAVWRLDVLSAAVLPTDVPFAVDRVVAAAPLSGAVTQAAGVGWGLRQAVTSSPVLASVNSVGR